MRTLVLLAAVTGLFLTANPALAYPTGAEALEARLLAKMGPDTRAWIVTEAARESSLHFLTDATPVNAALGHGASGADIDALAFLISMQVARDASGAVNSAVSSELSANATKEDARQAQMQSDSITNARREQMSGGEQEALKAQGSTFVDLLPPDKNAPKPPPAPTTPPLTESGQAMNLQDAMDRESQIDDMLDDAMKKITPARESLVQGLK
jgi:hypothetical protein